MNVRLEWTILLFMMAAPIYGEEAKKQQRPPDEKKLTVHLVEARVCRRFDLPEDLPKDAFPQVENPGFTLEFLIKGENLCGMKHQSLSLDKLTAGNGRDLLARQEQPAYEQWYSHLFLPPTHVGKFEAFSIRSNELLLEGMDGLTLKGSVTVFAADGSENFESDAMDPAEPGSTQIGDFAVTFTGETAVTPFQSPDAPEAEPSDKTSFVISVAGDAESIGRVEVVQGDKTLEQTGWNRTNDQASFEFQRSKDGECVIRLVCWKNRHEVEVPFEATVRLKAK